MALLFIAIILTLVYILFERHTGIILLAIVLFVVSFLPVEGFEEPELVDEVKLIQLQDDNKYYLEESGNVYLYAYNDRKIYEKDGKLYYRAIQRTYNESIVRQDETEVFCLEECKVPMLYKYEARAKIGIFSTAFFMKRVEYKIYIPKDTIRKIPYVKYS